MTVKLVMKDESTALSIQGTNYRAKDGIIEVSDAHAAELTKQHGYKTEAQHQAIQAAADKLRREQEAELKRMENADRQARIAEARALLESSGMKVSGGRA
jgi:major membrane immunogen (membrane-anchored lipoprotein)